MKYTDSTMKKRDFVVRMAEPDGGSDRAVIIVLSGVCFRESIFQCWFGVFFDEEQ